MRPTGFKLMGIMGLVLTLSIFVGCGSGGDLLDEVPTQITAAAIPQDGEDLTQEIDIFQGQCDQEAEPFLPFDVTLVIETGENTAPFRIESYDVFLRRNHGAYPVSVAPEDRVQYDDLSASEMPDLTALELNPLRYQNRSQIIPPNASTTIEGYLVWTQGDKAVYYSHLRTLPFLNSTFTFSTGATFVGYEATDFVYDIQFVLHCRSEENDTFNITTPWTPVHFANFDNC